MSQSPFSRRIDFERFCEADVREEILAPLIAQFGYFTGAENSVCREYHLKYNKLQLGRRKSSDAEIRGRADYICWAAGSICWTIEAKPPSDPLDEAACAQAWTYANHPEVRAVYFVLCNGREIAVFQTNRGAKASALFRCSYEELGAKLAVLNNILGPAAIVRDHPLAEIGTGAPLAQGLRSSARIVNGRVVFDRTEPPLPPLMGMLMSISMGRVDRDADGRLQVTLVAMVPNQSLQATNEKFGLDRMVLTSDSSSLSQSADAPTVFGSTRRVVLPAGEEALNMMNWQTTRLPFSITSTVDTKAVGHLQGKEFVGEFSARYTFGDFGSMLAAGGFNLLLA